MLQCPTPQSIYCVLYIGLRGSGRHYSSIRQHTRPTNLTQNWMQKLAINDRHQKKSFEKCRWTILWSELVRFKIVTQLSATALQTLMSLFWPHFTPVDIDPDILVRTFLFFLSQFLLFSSCWCSIVLFPRPVYYNLLQINELVCHGHYGNDTQCWS
jgi:hypothetical protein